jgi:Ca2+-binding RTX toxin-like protein
MLHDLERGVASGETGSPGKGAPAAIGGGLPDVFETTDADGSIATTYTLAIGSTAEGNLDSPADHDFYAVNLVAGQTYSFVLTGTGTDNVVDPYLRLYGPNAQTFVVAADDGLQGNNSLMKYIPNVSGTYYLDASSFDGGLGQYGLSVTAGSRPSIDLKMGAGIIDTDLSWSATPGTAAIVTWGFRQTTDGDSPGFKVLTAAQQTAVKMALQLWADVADVTFQQVNPTGTTNNASILFATYSANDGGGAYASYPGDPSSGSKDGDVWLNRGSVSTTSLPFGSYSFNAILHEIGHTLGLSHPGLYNAAPGVDITYSSDAQFVQDSEQYSVMSYFAETETGASFGGTNVYADTPMLLDIYALQQIYGANMSTRSGDTTYGFNSTAGNAYKFVSGGTPAFAIWDGGGVDTIDASGYNLAQTINLAAGSFSSVLGHIENIAIALGVTVEDAISGSGNDDIYLTSADVDNLINGSGGNDTAHVSYVYGDVYDLSGTAADLIMSGLAGTDTFLNTEYFVFADGTQITAANLLSHGPVSTPDLTAGNVHVSDAAPNAGQTVTVTSTISNTGDASTGGLFAVGIYLSTDATIDASDTFLGDQALPVLAAHASQGQTLDVALPGDLLTGVTYYIGVIADSDGNVNETSEINNASAGTAITISQDPVFTNGPDTATLFQAGGPWHALAGDDHVTGSSGNDILFGDDGNDTIEGGGGADQLFGGTGIDTVSYEHSAVGVTVNLTLKSTVAQTSAGDASGDKLDTFENVIGSQHDDTLTGAKLGGILSGLGGDDTLKAVGGTNTLDGGDGNDTLTGGKGNDTLTGGVGNDQLSDAGGINTLDGGDGDDTLTGGKSNDSLLGGIGNDHLSDAAGTNTLDGGDGNDTLVGGKGVDTLIGGIGDDFLTGGKGNDHFVFNAGFGHDTVTDFVVGKKVTDVIEFDHKVFADFAAISAHSAQVGADTAITTDDGNTLTLQNVQLAALNANYFLIK